MNPTGSVLWSTDNGLGWSTEPLTITPTGSELVVPTEGEVIPVTPTGEELVTPTGDELVTPTSGEPVTPTGGEVTPVTVDSASKPLSQAPTSKSPPQSRSPPQPKSPPQFTPRPPSSTPTDGVGVGISCSLVQSAASAYKNAISMAGTVGGNDPLVSYYAQILHMACLRSSPLCDIPECSEVNNIQHVIPPGCKDKGYLGSQFEEYIFKELVQESSFSDVSGRQAKMISTINQLTQQIEKKEIGSPFLNFMMSVGVVQDTRKVVQIYYGTIGAFEDLQPIFVKYIHKEIGSSNKGSIKDTIRNISQSHSQFLRCGIAPSYFAQSTDYEQSIKRRDSTPITAQLPPAAAAAASFFVPGWCTTAKQ